MTDYQAPVKDMMFALEHLADLHGVCGLPAFSETSSELVQSVLEEAGKFAGEVLSPLNRVGDLIGTKIVNRQVREASGFAEAYQKFAEGGWSALPCNPEYGGMGLPESVGLATMEIWSAANVSFALCPMLGQGAIEAIEHHASQDLRDLYLPKMISGEWTGTMNLTEPQAGSDLSLVRTKAVRDGDHYLISGTKIFITWGDHSMTDNIVHLVLARIEGAPEGVKGISLFLVPKYLVNADGSLGARNDAFAQSVEHKMGIHGSPTCVMSFGEKAGAIGYLIGEQNAGLSYMFTMMNHARLNVGVEGVALSDRALQQALHYAVGRIQGKPPGADETSSIFHHADVRRMLMLMKSLTEASRAVCYVTSAAFDFAHKAEDPDVANAARVRAELLTPISKAWSTEVSQEVTSIGVQIHGGMGFIEETGAAQLMRDARITTIYEGTTGIQANDFIGRKVIRDNGAALQTLMTEMTELARQASETFPVQASALEAAVAQLDQVTRFILRQHSERPLLAGGAAFNYMMGAGTVIAGWLMLRSALAANVLMAGDEAFYSTKITTTGFFFGHVMPRATGYLTAATADTEPFMELEHSDFHL
ncbi:MAG: acyl-CoA dehydrogenase [Pseudomonadales bacterium]|nr:acyl-CoA dehydrogenase [Pseudomonadales bacterium]